MSQWMSSGPRDDYYVRSHFFGLPLVVARGGGRSTTTVENVRLISLAKLLRVEAGPIPIEIGEFR